MHRRSGTGYTGIPRMDLRHRGGRGTLRPASAGGNGRQGQLVRVHPADHLRILTHRARPEPAHLRGEHRLLHRPRRAAGTRAGPEPVPGPAPAPGLRPAAAGAAARGGRHRPALHLRPPGTPRAKAWNWPESRSPSPPPPSSSPRRSLPCRSWWSASKAPCAPPATSTRRSPRPSARGPTHGAAPGDHSAGAARPGLRRRAVLRPRLGEFGATLTFAGSLQGVTRTLPLEIYLQRETDADAAVALSLLLVAVAVAVVGLSYRRPRLACTGRSAR